MPSTASSASSSAGEAARSGGLALAGPGRQDGSCGNGATCMKPTRENRPEAGAPEAVPQLICYPLEPDPPAIEPARAARDWMDRDRPALRLSLPAALDRQRQRLGAARAGRVRGVLVRRRRAGQPDGARPTSRRAPRRFAVSHFGHGVLTLHTGYLFRTSPGWALWVRGAPNSAKRNLVPLDGLVETDWLEFPFTMNWRFTRAGQRRVRQRASRSASSPRSRMRCSTRCSPRPARSTPTRRSRRPTRRARRAAAEFNGRLAAARPRRGRAGWQRHYLRGEAAGEPPGFHLTKRRLRPVRRD